MSPLAPPLFFWNYSIHTLNQTATHFSRIVTWQKKPNNNNKLKIKKIKKKTEGENCKGWKYNMNYREFLVHRWENESPDVGKDLPKATPVAEPGTRDQRPSHHSKDVGSPATQLALSIYWITCFPYQTVSSLRQSELSSFLLLRSPCQTGSSIREASLVRCFTCSPCFYVWNTSFFLEWMNIPCADLYTFRFQTFL